MTYIVNDNCIKCKYMDCVEVCPVDCFYEGENMLVIHPDECIDCGVCEPECPVEAIKPDTEPGAEKWLSINAQYAKPWPNITLKKDPPPTPKRGLCGSVQRHAVLLTLSPGCSTHFTIGGRTHLSKQPSHFKMPKMYHSRRSGRKNSRISAARASGSSSAAK